MTGTNLASLFTIHVQHGYFPGGVCTCLQFIPDAGTQLLQQRFGFSMRTQHDGFGWYANTAQSLPEYIAYVAQTSGETAFRFTIHTRQQEFFGYTELPVNLAGQIIVTTTRSTGNEKNIPLTVQITGKPAATGMGTLTILFADLLSIMKSTTAPQFTLSFAARKTQWQYYVINSSAMVLNNPAVTGSSNIVFNGPQPVTLSNGQQAMLFTSGNELIPLSRQPRYVFSLVNRAQGETGSNRFAAKTIVKGLPTPDPVQFELLEINGSLQMSSPMYVYI